MYNYHLGTGNGFHWGLKPVSIYSKLHTFSTFSGSKKINVLTLSTQGTYMNMDKMIGSERKFI